MRRVLLGLIFTALATPAISQSDCISEASALQFHKDRNQKVVERANFDGWEIEVWSAGEAQGWAITRRKGGIMCAISWGNSFDPAKINLSKVFRGNRAILGEAL